MLFTRHFSFLCENEESQITCNAVLGLEEIYKTKESDSVRSLFVIFLVESDYM